MKFKLAAGDVYGDAIRRLDTPYLAIIMLAFFISPYLYLGNRFGVHNLYSLGRLIEEVHVGYVFGTLLVALFVVVGPFMTASIFLSVRTLKFLPFTSLFRGWMVLLTIVYASVLARLHFGPPDPIRLSIAGGLVGAIVVLVGIMAVVFTLMAIRRWLTRRMADLYPDAVLTDCLLGILSEVEKPNAHWVDVGFKNKLITELERTAVCIERHLPRRLRSGNPATDHWTRDRSERMAAGIRSLVKWLFTPQSDTREQFTSRIANCFTIAARGDWDSFELAQPEKLSRPELFRNRARFILTAVFSAAIPIALLFLVKRLGIVAEPFLTYLTLGGYLWAALSLVSSLDPGYSTKLSAIKDISSLFPFAKKGKE